LANPEDGTFGNRFDDPGALRGIPQEERFRTVYCATRSVAAFGETISRFRPSLKLLAQLESIDDAEPWDSKTLGVIPSEWRLSRHLGISHIDYSALFVDLDAAESAQFLRESLASVAVELGYSDVDLGVLRGQNRRLTQEAARCIYELPETPERPALAGIRYVSRLNSDWECWAVFHDRFYHSEEPTRSILPDDPGLLEAAELFGLRIE
jgi:hypothetical protein